MSRAICKEECMVVQSLSGARICAMSSWFPALFHACTTANKSLVFLSPENGM